MLKALLFRAFVRLAALLHLLLPVYLLWVIEHTQFKSWDFPFSSALFLIFLLIVRWDFVSFVLPYCFFTAYLVIAYSKGGPLAAAAGCAFIALAWTALRWRPRGEVLHAEFPLKNGTFNVVHGGAFWLSNYHGAVAKFQRYALDVVKLNRFGVRATGLCPLPLERYAIYSEPVYSPCDGIIAAACNDIPDQPPGVFVKKLSAGNHVWIKADRTDIFVLLAHLQCASLLVKTGDRVTAGQPIGKIGNTGNTSEPHLHIHAQFHGPNQQASGGKPVQLAFNGKWHVRNDCVRKTENSASQV
jgi:hypothetical protein